jgi:CDP-diacylglycerol--serine O-phosphatidyltransferase
MGLFDKENRFNVANLVSFGNITAGLVAIYFIIEGNFLAAIILAWIAGALDIIDGKVARKFALSTEFGVQLDSFADFLSFVLMPSFLLYYALIRGSDLFGAGEAAIGAVFIFYVISGLRRLIEFNLKTDAGEVAKYFVGVPTPLGAILLWLLYLLFTFSVIDNPYLIAALAALAAWSLNSKIKIPHP